MNLKDYIRTIPDFPKDGIMFRDVTSLMSHPKAFLLAVAEMAQAWSTDDIDLIAGIEARGFIFGGALATVMGKGFLPLRKANKLPHDTLSEAYTLEYGEDKLEVHTADVPKGAKILIVDDLIATGGTATAAARLINRAGAQVVGLGFAIDLPDLGGTARLKAEGFNVNSLLEYVGH